MVVTDIQCLKLFVTMNKDDNKTRVWDDRCQMCDGPITVEEYYYCDICPKCLDNE